MTYLPIAPLALALALLCGCRSLEKAVSNEKEREVREIVRDEVPAIVEQSIGRLAMRIMPWLLGPTGLLAGGGIIAARKKKHSNDRSM